MRGRFAAAVVGTVVLGLLSRRIDGVPAWVGDLLWASMVFLLVSLLRPRRSVPVRATVALAVCYLVEFSQLIRIGWLDRLRDNQFGHLVLGSTFYWADLIAYLAGVLLAAGLTWRWATAPAPVSAPA